MTTNTNTTKPKPITLAAIAKAKADPAALAALAAGLSTERDALARRTIDTTKDHYVLLGAIADATTRASATYDANSTTLTSTDFCTATGTAKDGDWNGWSVPTIKMALIVHRCHTADAYDIWTNLSSAFEKCEDGSGRIGDVSVVAARVSLFSRHAVAYANWVNLYDAKVAHADGGFTEKPATIAARERSAAEAAKVVAAEAKADREAKRLVNLVRGGMDTVAFGPFTWAALRSLDADAIAEGLEVFAALHAELSAGTYKVTYTAPETETGATEKPKAKRTAKPKA